MGFIPRITCRRCGRQFSGLRSRCPYCGTRRVKQSDRVPSPTPSENSATPAGQRAAVNTRWQLIFGAILLAAVLLAVVVLVSVSLNGTTQTTPSPTLGAYTLPPTTPPPPTPTPTPTPMLESLSIYCWDRQVGENFTERVGNTVPLTVSAWPSTIPLDGAVKWESSDESVATVKKDAEGTGCIVTIVGTGRCTISVTAYNLTTKTDAICIG